MMKPKKVPKIDGLKSHLTLLVMLFVAFSGSAQLTIDNSPTLSQLVDENRILTGSETIGSNATFQGKKYSAAESQTSKFSTATITLEQMRSSRELYYHPIVPADYLNSLEIAYKKQTEMLNHFKQLF